MSERRQPKPAPAPPPPPMKREPITLAERVCDAALDATVVVGLVVLIALTVSVALTIAGAVLATLVGVGLTLMVAWSICQVRDAVRPATRRAGNAGDTGGTP